MGALVGFTLPLPVPAIAAETNPDCQLPSVPAEPLTLTAGLGPQGIHTMVVEQGKGSVLVGSLTAGAARVSGAFLCVYSQTLSDSEKSLIGLAVTRPDSTYRFAVPPGPSRRLSIAVQSAQSPSATTAGGVIKTRVKPSLRIQPNPARNKHFVDISGRIPGPHNDRVTVILEAASKARAHWFEFRGASAHDDGRFVLRYFFSRTDQATTYLIRAKVLGAPGYPYESGVSREIPLRVRPWRHAA
ncbi:MAG TPA: hypothetical protein VHA76_07360, partial [Solirubrobacterales bacterium]|nr:hypothetical protein [Solirubrobacterales bacterium]